MTDIVEMLESVEFMGMPDGVLDYTSASEAAAEITRLREKVAKADALAEQVQRVKDFRYDPNIGIELNRLEEALTAYRATKEGGAL